MLRHSAPAVLDRAYREIDERGITVRRIEAPLTQEQRAQREAESRRKKEQERLAKEERMRNQALLDAYSSEKDIEVVRDRTVRDIEKSLNLANESYAEAAKRQKELSDEMQFYRNKPAPKALLDAMKENESELRATPASSNRNRRRSMPCAPSTTRNGAATSS